ncbi:MAG TPA: hypothetical protein VMS00_08320 [Acidimicrobiales bacterium]|nr:hypothetical protein [Acidimicrobiales bacterium]
MANCAHGFPQSECLICRTLGVTSSPAGATKTKTRDAGSADISAMLATRTGALPETRPHQADVREGGADRSGRGMSPVWPVLGIIVVGGVLLWAFAGVVSLAFHIGEYVAVGAIAGWLGYKLGHARGRRSRNT